MTRARAYKCGACKPCTNPHWKKACAMRPLADAPEDDLAPKTPPLAAASPPRKRPAEPATTVATPPQKLQHVLEPGPDAEALAPLALLLAPAPQHAPPELKADAEALALLALLHLASSAEPGVIPDTPDASTSPFFCGRPAEVFELPAAPRQPPAEVFELPAPSCMVTVLHDGAVAMTRAVPVDAPFSRLYRALRALRAVLPHRNRLFLPDGRWCPRTSSLAEMGCAEAAVSLTYRPSHLAAGHTVVSVSHKGTRLPRLRLGLELPFSELYACLADSLERDAATLRLLAPDGRTCHPSDRMIPAPEIRLALVDV